METIIFGIIIALIILYYVFSFFADYLNDQMRTKPIPENVEDVYDTEQYAKWLSYSRETSRIGFIESALAFLFILLMLLNGGFLMLATWTRDMTSSVYTEMFAFLGIIFAINFVYRLPFNAYRTFSIETRYGFNRTTVNTFIKDRIISVILTVLLGGGLVYFITWLLENTGNYFILFAFIGIMVVFLFINITYTKLLLPLFNTLTPLEDGELKTRIEDFAASQNYEIKKIHVMDASKRSSKLNAFFSGFGRFKNVVLFDTLINVMDNDQIMAVLAHEIGHAKHKDVVKNIVFSMVQFALILSLFFAFVRIDVFAQAFGWEDAVHYGFMLLVFAIALSPVLMPLNVLRNTISRRYEYAADKFAAKNIGKAPMKEALKVLARENFAQLTVHPLYVFLYYSHPPITFRVAAIDHA